jgi:hypothetical protein
VDAESWSDEDIASRAVVRVATRCCSCPDRKRVCEPSDWCFAAATSVSGSGITWGTSVLVVLFEYRVSISRVKT